MSRYTVGESETTKIFRVYRISGKNSALIDEVCKCDEKDDAVLIRKLLEEYEQALKSEAETE